LIFVFQENIVFYLDIVKWFSAGSDEIELLNPGKVNLVKKVVLGENVSIRAGLNNVRM
jgi:hypothetical protein